MGYSEGVASALQPRDPNSICVLLERYDLGDIDFPTLLQGIVTASLQEDEEEDDDEHPWDNYPGFNDPVWIRHARDNRWITPEQAEQIFAAVGQALMTQDSVGGDAASFGAGAAAPGIAPPPTPSVEDAP